MCKGNRIYPDCDGFVWSSKAECESDKCQRKCQDKTDSKAECESDKCQCERQDKPASAYVETKTPNRVMEHEGSGFYTTQVANESTELRDTQVGNERTELRDTQVVNERTDLRDTQVDNENTDLRGTQVVNERPQLRDTQVAKERTELRGFSVVFDDSGDTSGSTDISPVAVYTRSGEQTELKRARGVRHPAYQCEILQGQRPVWKDDRCTWEFTQQKPSSGLDTTVESTTQVWDDV